MKKYYKIYFYNFLKILNSKGKRLDFDKKYLNMISNFELSIIRSTELYIHPLNMFLSFSIGEDQIIIQDENRCVVSYIYHGKNTNYDNTIFSEIRNLEKILSHYSSHGLILSRRSIMRAYSCLFFHSMSANKLIRIKDFLKKYK